jgi:hypothetical protein
MQKIYIGIDNGVTGSIGIIYNKTEKYKLIKIPIKTEQSYTKTKQQITRICFDNFFNLLNALKHQGNCKIALERPMINHTRFKATISASRCLESQLIAIEQLLLSYIYIDSKTWQKIYFPKGIKGSVNLKKISRDIGIRIFPEMKDEIIQQKDADGLFIAKYLREYKK